MIKNSSRFRGVSLNKASRKWEARIRESGKNHYLGSFTDEEMAARAFDNAAIAMRGPQAVCNFPREGSNVKVCRLTPRYEWQCCRLPDLEVQLVRSRALSGDTQTGIHCT